MSRGLTLSGRRLDGPISANPFDLSRRPKPFLAPCHLRPDFCDNARVSGTESRMPKYGRAAHSKGTPILRGSDQRQYRGYINEF